MHYKGQLYRALNPLYARERLSGRGAELYGGRFNPKGMPALYTSLTIMTALREANQAGSLQPTTLVSYDADFEPLFDTRDPNLLEKHQITLQSLSNTTWRDEMNMHGEALSQQLDLDLKQAGFHGLVVRSFAPGTTDADLNCAVDMGNIDPKSSVFDRRRAPAIEIASTLRSFRITSNDEIEPRIEIRIRHRHRRRNWARTQANPRRCHAAEAAH